MSFRSKLACVFALTVEVFASHAFADLRIVGTDLLGLEFTKAAYAFSGHAGVRLTLAFDGSRPGLAELKSHRADLALLILPPAELAALSEFQTRPLGYQRLLVVVPATCPVEQVSCDELALIFGVGDGPGRGATRWSELGLTGEWAGKTIVPIAPEGGSGLGAEFFRQNVLNGRAFNPSVRRYASRRDLAAEFSRDARTMALVSASLAGVANLKIIPVARARGQPACAASAESLHAGDYPLRLPVQLVFRAERAAALSKMFEFFWSADAARELERAAVTPLPATVRGELLRGTRLKEKPLNYEERH